MIGLGAHPLDIIQITDCDHKGFTKLLRDILFEVDKNFENGRKKTFIFLYFTGTGEIDATTKALLNDERNYSFPLER